MESIKKDSQENDLLNYSELQNSQNDILLKAKETISKFQRQIKINTELKSEKIYSNSHRNNLKLEKNYYLNNSHSRDNIISTEPNKNIVQNDKQYSGMKYFQDNYIHYNTNENKVNMNRFNNSDNISPISYFTYNNIKDKFNKNQNNKISIIDEEDENNSKYEIEDKKQNYNDNNNNNKDDIQNVINKTFISNNNYLMNNYFNDNIPENNLDNNRRILKNDNINSENFQPLKNENDLISERKNINYLQKEKIFNEVLEENEVLKSEINKLIDENKYLNNVIKNNPTKNEVKDYYHSPIRNINNNINAMKNENSKILKKNEELLKSIKEVKNRNKLQKKRIDDIEQMLKDKNEYINQMETKMKDINTNNDKNNLFKTKYNELLIRFDIVNKELNQLKKSKSKFNELQTEYEKLKSNYNMLLKSEDKLKSSHKEKSEEKIKSNHKEKSEEKVKISHKEKSEEKLNNNNKIKLEDEYKKRIKKLIEDNRALNECIDKLKKENLTLKTANEKNINLLKKGNNNKNNNNNNNKNASKRNGIDDNKDNKPLFLNINVKSKKKKKKPLDNINKNKNKKEKDNSMNALKRKSTLNLQKSNLNNKKENEKSEIVYRDVELNSMDYEDALKYDQRNFSQYYFSLIKSQNPLFFTFYECKDYNSQMIKINLLFFSFSINYIISAMFYTDDTMHKIYIDEGGFDFTYMLPQMFYSLILSIVLGMIIKNLGLYQDNILNVRKLKRNKESPEAIFKEVSKKIKIKIIFFFIISYILAFSFWAFLGCFCAVYSNTQIHLLIEVSSSFGISFITPFFIYLIPGFLRTKALQDRKKERPCLYRLSKITQIL